MAEVFVNKVSESGLISLDLEEFGGKVSWIKFDLKPFLFMELILKEKDFREALKNHDWEQYRNRYVAVFCSADAVIPMWAYMLVGSYLQPVNAEVFFGTPGIAREALMLESISKLDASEYAGQRVVIKGCGDNPVAESVYLSATVKLMPVVKSIMYGEPCSTVPIFKRKMN